MHTLSIDKMTKDTRSHRGRCSSLSTYWSPLLTGVDSVLTIAGTRILVMVLMSLSWLSYFHSIAVIITLKYNTACLVLLQLLLNANIKVFMLSSLALLRVQEIHPWEPREDSPGLPSVSVTVVNFDAFSKIINCRKWKCWAPESNTTFDVYKLVEVGTA
jgi:hypothetical protein